EAQRRAHAHRLVIGPDRAADHQRQQSFRGGDLLLGHERQRHPRAELCPGRRAGGAPAAGDGRRPPSTTAKPQPAPARSTTTQKVEFNGQSGELMPGTVLTRPYKGRTIEVKVVDPNGRFECDGEVYRSLSAVAKAVTGSHWSGKLFFGLTAAKNRKHG